MVIAGSEEAMQQAAQRAAAHGAQKVHRLAVSVPSHCALLNEQARRLAQAFADVTLTRPRYAYLSGSTARQLWQPEQIADDGDEYGAHRALARDDGSGQRARCRRRWRCLPARC